MPSAGPAIVIHTMRRPRTFGKSDVYDIVVYPTSVVFALFTADMAKQALKSAQDMGKDAGKGFIERWRDQLTSTSEHWQIYISMTPEQVLGANLRDNFALFPSEIVRIEYRRKRRSGAIPYYWKVEFETTRRSYEFESDYDCVGLLRQAFGGKVREGGMFF